MRPLFLLTHLTLRDLREKPNPRAANQAVPALEQFPPVWQEMNCVDCSPQTQRRVIFHLDMDAFYASIEQRDAPEDIENVQAIRIAGWCC